VTTLITERLVAASIETAIAALIVLAAGALIGRRSPRLVAMLWLVVLAKPLLTLAAGSIVPLPLLPANVASITRRAEVQTSVMKIVRKGGVKNEQRQTSGSDPAKTLFAIWLTGALLVLARTIHGRLRLQSIIDHSRPASPRLRELYERLAPRGPRLVVSDDLDGPAIGGVLRPAILIPSWMDERADEAQVSWTLRHELRHSSARDTIGIALREASLIALWFHPLIWLAAKKWEAATELACDRDVVASDDDAVDYADALYRTLLNVRQQRRVALAAGLFATRSKIGTRIAALIERPLPPRSGKASLMMTIFLAAVMLLVGGGLASRARARGHVEEVNDQRSFAFDFDGVFDLDAAHVVRVSPGGWVDMTETRDGTTRRLRVESSSRTYTVNGRAAPFDAEAAAFEARLTVLLRRNLKR
jgi:beta-lactamase regulating signal transducer with metallopeptidase domain